MKKEKRNVERIYEYFISNFYDLKNFIKNAKELGVKDNTYIGFNESQSRLSFNYYTLETDEEYAERLDLYIKLKNNQNLEAVEQLLNNDLGKALLIDKIKNNPQLIKELKELL